MPELILKFNLPEENDAADLAVNASGLHNALWDFKQELRNMLKHGNHSSVESAILEEINELFYKKLEDNKVSQLF